MSIGKVTDTKSTSSEQNSEEVVISQNTTESNHEEKLNSIYVYICGAVKKPGVYKLSANSRICDGITAAGGLRKRASETQVNQAELLTDGEQVYIPYRSKNRKVTVETSECADDSASNSGSKINLNTATVDDLKTLTGIGDAKAASIIQYREEHGRYSSIEEIKNISGIKDGVYSKIETYITV